MISKEMKKMMEIEKFNSLAENKKPVQFKDRIALKNYLYDNNLDMSGNTLKQNDKVIGNFEIKYSSRKICLCYPVTSVKLVMC